MCGLVTCIIRDCVCLEGINSTFVLIYQTLFNRRGTCDRRLCLPHYLLNKYLTLVEEGRKLEGQVVSELSVLFLMCKLMQT